jgi:UDP-2,4-diacetamido-2,4,6-trideoxy-beta-L-altropyranose hydrolase
MARAKTSRPKTGGSKMKLGNLLIRADASVEMGTGHVMRCLALAQAWQDAGGSAAFAMAESTPATVARLAAEGFQVCPVAESAGTKEDANSTAELARARAAEWIVVDGYQFGAGYLEIIKSSGRRLLCLDDAGGSESYSADLVLNQNLNATEDLYLKRRPETRLLLGTRYALLRREFVKWRGWKRDVETPGNKVLITMGGSDPGNVTLEVLEALRTAVAGNLEAVIVVGGSNPHFESIVRVAESFPGKIRVQRDAANMAELMAWADIAVSAAGSTCWEMCMLGLPAIVLDIAPNQERLSRELEREGCAIHIAQADFSQAGISSDNSKVVAIREKIELLMQSSQIRGGISRRAAELVDGNGAGRVVAAMRAQAITMRRAESRDCRILWEWANETAVRRASFDSSPITWEQHVQWFAQQLGDADSSFLMFEYDRSIPVGTARFRATSDVDLEISVTIAPEFRGQGLAPGVLDEAAESAFERDSIERIHAFIRTENRVSVKSFENAGFVLVGATQVRGSDALHYVRARKASARWRSIPTAAGVGYGESFEDRGLHRNNPIRIAINQPAYLPWIGYFDLIDQVDLFVVLDNVQFEKQSWQQRNRIKTPGGLQWLSVPVKFRGRLGQLIQEVEIRDSGFCVNHLRGIELAYRRSPYFERYFPPLKQRIEEMRGGLLVDLNLTLLQWLAECLGIRTRMVKASTLEASGKRTELLGNICAVSGAKRYISPLGSAAYLLPEQGILQSRGVEVLFQNYEHPVYRQMFPPFEPFASVIDLLFNEGDAGLEVLRRGRRGCLSGQELTALPQAV